MSKSIARIDHAVHRGGPEQAAGDRRRRFLKQLADTRMIEGGYISYEAMPGKRTVHCVAMDYTHPTFRR